MLLDVYTNFWSSLAPLILVQIDHPDTGILNLSHLPNQLRQTGINKVLFRAMHQILARERRLLGQGKGE